MARTREPEIEFDPRHRIVGAIVLVTLAVILLPLILDEHPNPEIIFADSGSQETPPRSGDTAGDTTTKPEKVIIKKLNVSQVAPNNKNSGDSERSKPVEPAKTVAQTRVVTKKVETQAPKPVAKVESKATNTAEAHTWVAATQPHWAVQVGTFSNQSNVRRLKKQLEHHGFSVMFKDIKLKQGNAVRVRVGPYSTRASANKAQGKIKQDIGIKGVVVAGP
jgi:DedD protein